MEEAYRIAIEEFFKISLADLEFSILYLGKYSTILRTLGRVILIDPSDVINVHLLEEYNKVDYVFYSCRLSDSYNREVALEIYRTFKPIFFVDPTTYTDLFLDIPGEYLVNMHPGFYNIADLKINAMLGLYEVPVIAYLIKMAGMNILYTSRSEHLIFEKEKVDAMILPLAGRYLERGAPIYDLVRNFRPKRIFAINWNEQEIDIFIKNILEIAPYAEIIPLKPYASYRVALGYP